jgi:hypothetical protein
MLNQCANSQCGKPFLRLGEGKLFQVQAECAAIAQTGSHAPRLRKQPRHVERYWLCDPCAELWTLVRDRSHGISLLHLPVPPAGSQLAPRAVSGEIA